MSRIGDKLSKFLEAHINEYSELLISEYNLVSYINLVYVNSKQENDNLAKYERL